MASGISVDLRWYVVSVLSTMSLAETSIPIILNAGFCSGSGFLGAALEAPLFPPLPAVAGLELAPATFSAAGVLGLSDMFEEECCDRKGDRWTKVSSVGL